MRYVFGHGEADQLLSMFIVAALLSYPLIVGLAVHETADAEAAEAGATYVEEIDAERGDAKVANGRVTPLAERLLRSGPIRFVGKISLSFYLMHPNVFIAVSESYATRPCRHDQLLPSFTSLANLRACPLASC